MTKIQSILLHFLHFFKAGFFRSHFCSLLQLAMIFPIWLSLGSCSSDGTSKKKEDPLFNQTANFDQASLPSASDVSSKTIWIFSDLHYLAPSLHDDGILFRQVMENGDGKITEYTPQILDTFIEKAQHEKPDLVLILGDLTFNGELESLQQLAGKLAELENSGIDVAVLPGNHDILNPLARSYFEGEGKSATKISFSQFMEQMEDFGWNEALYQDTNSFSYFYPLSDSCWILMLDGNTPAWFGGVLPSTLEWAEPILEEAQQKGITVISGTHQNVLDQNALFGSDQYSLVNAAQVRDLLEEEGVFYNVSGHTHITHASTDGQLTDIAIGSISCEPLQYLVIHIDGSDIVNLHPENLEGFETPALERFIQVNRRKLEEELAAAGIEDKEIQEKMESFALEVNRKYYGGKLQPETDILQQEGWDLWKKYGRDTFWFQYLTSLLPEDARENS